MLLYTYMTSYVYNSSIIHLYYPILAYYSLDYTNYMPNVSHYYTTTTTTIALNVGASAALLQPQ